MQKFYLFFITLLLGLCYFFYQLADNRANQIKNLETMLNQCETKEKEMQNAINKKNEASKRSNNAIESIRTIVKTVQSPCNCYDSRIDASIFKRVRGEE